MGQITNNIPVPKIRLNPERVRQKLLSLGCPAKFSYPPDGIFKGLVG